MITLEKPPQCSLNLYFYEKFLNESHLKKSFLKDRDKKMYKMQTFLRYVWAENIDTPHRRTKQKKSLLTDYENHYLLIKWGL